MKAFLLAGGYGTRLKPLTDHTPKCLVEINGKPLLEYWLEQLTAIGCNDILINTHYLYNQVENYVANSPYAQYVTTVYEPKLLGTMGSIKANRDFLSDDVSLIAHADNFCLPDWDKFISEFRHRPKTCHLSMMLFKTETPWSCGLVRVDDEHVLKEYHEKPEAARTSPQAFGNLANAAVFLLDQKALNYVSETQDDCSDFCRDFLPLQVGKAITFLNDGVHIDIGTPETYSLAQKVAGKLEIEC